MYYMLWPTEVWNVIIFLLKLIFTKISYLILTTILPTPTVDFNKIRRFILEPKQILESSITSFPVLLKLDVVWISYTWALHKTSLALPSEIDSVGLWKSSRICVFIQVLKVILMLGGPQTIVWESWKNSVPTESQRHEVIKSLYGGIGTQSQTSALIFIMHTIHETRLRKSFST